jgi:DNA topoisomerase-1
MDVVIVESPAKAKTINKYLGKNFEVVASFGHVRDLPAKDGSVIPDDDFKMLWETDAKATKRLSEIAALVKAADRVVLATDPDREGEAISWHVLEILRNKRVLKDKPVQRVVFNAITKDSILEAMRNPREIDQSLVDAYLARRALDYLVGFNLSPVLWRKLPGAKSAGRVQSVALRLVCDRELEIEKFVAREYWSLVAHLRTAKDAAFTARLVGADGQKISRLDIGAGAEAEAFKAALETARLAVTPVEAKPARRNPQAPFTTSTLQQEASRKLGMAPEATMRTAQKLYEGIDLGGETVGLITYMRTDGVDVAPEAVAAARALIAKEFGANYVPDAPRKYQVKAKNAQEAHEAIRPTDPSRLPRDVARHLQPDQAKLYELIWNRLIASQMESAVLERTTVDIEAKAGGRVLDLRATGQVVRFDGFLTLYQEGKDDEEDEESGRLPPMSKDEALKKDKIDATQHFTEPPPRFTEATLVKRMEELGIGRPSTYASTLAVLREREYVRLEKKRLIAEDKGRLVTAFLEGFFGRYVSYDFTADLEGQLDRISNAEIDWKQVLRDFWGDFSVAIGGAMELRTTDILESLNELLGPHIFPAKPDGGNPRACPACANGQLSLKAGKFGAFIGCSNYPECKFTRTLSDRGEQGDAGPGGLGEDPATGAEISLRRRRDGGYYVQRGDGKDAGRASVPKTMAPEDVTLEKALALLSLPREVAKHPDSGEPILAAIGPYGPYVKHGKTYASLSKDDDVLEIGGNRAIDLIMTKEAGGGRGGAGGEMKVFGDHPQGGAIALKAGRFGPYLAWGKVNATLPKGTDLQSLTLDEAVKIVEAKAAGQPSDGRLLGDHPDGGPITVRPGRFGAYVTWNKVNATLSKAMTLETVSLEEAIRLIEDRISSGGAKPKKPAKKTAEKKTAKTTTAAEKKAADGEDGDATEAKPAAKKTSAKKTPANKTPAKKKPAAKKAIEDSDETPF